MAANSQIEYMNSTEVTIEYAVVRDGAEAILNITGHVWAGSPDVMRMPNGDPGYPGEDGGCEIDAIEVISSDHELCLITEEGDLTAAELESIDERMQTAAAAIDFDDDYVEDYYHDDDHYEQPKGRSYYKDENR